MAKKSDIIIFQNFNETQLKRLINQLSKIREYDTFIDYIYDPTTKLRAGNELYSINEHVLVSIESLYGTIKTDCENELLPGGKVLGKIIDPLFFQENYLKVQLITKNNQKSYDIYKSYISKINII
jgi:hypothetical protein